PATPAEQYQAIRKDYEAAAGGGDGTDEGRRKRIAELDQLRPALGQRYLDLAERYPTDPDGAEARVASRATPVVPGRPPAPPLPPAGAEKEVKVIRFGKLVDGTGRVPGAGRGPAAPLDRVLRAASRGCRRGSTCRTSTGPNKRRPLFRAGLTCRTRPF